MNYAQSHYVINANKIFCILDFDRFEKESPKMQDWRFFNFEADYTEARMKYTDEAAITHTYANLPLFHCPDLVIQPEDIATQTRIFEEVRVLSSEHSVRKIHLQCIFFSIRQKETDFHTAMILKRVIKV